MLRKSLVLAVLTGCYLTSLQGHEAIFHLDPFEVQGRADPLIGETVSASQGFIHQVDLEYRPLLRPGEILESVPGFIATQHSGTGKANQYFLRGFNLDHGTDFSVHVDGMPVNLPTHGHGQGYTDINFLIPELVDSIQYMKGPYYASVGDFSSAGSSHISTVNFLNQNFAVLNVGENGFARTVLANSHEIQGGVLLSAFEAQYYDGPWEIGENLNKFNTLIKFTRQSENTRYGISFMGYDSKWDSADQIPLRAVESGLISPLGSLDDDLGGTSSRFSLSGNYLNVVRDTVTTAELYAIYYDLSLWSNFTYFLDDPVDGDEFEQFDNRMVYGANVARSLYIHGNGDLDSKHTFGAQIRYDDITEVGLYQSSARQRLRTIREDAVGELAIGVYYEGEWQLSQKLKGIVGLRGDYYYFDVDSNLGPNSGTEDATRVSPKVSLAYSPTESVEFFLSGGLGFHSNDARGTTITLDPTDGITPVDKVDPLVQSRGAEIGSRIVLGNKLNSSVSLWYLELDSELLFVGDAGITEPSRPSDRYGIELANHFTLSKGLVVELDAAFTEAQFNDSDPAGDAIPGALDTVLSAALTAQSETGWIGSLRLRHFGPRPLIEDSSVESNASTVINLRTGYQTENWSLFLDVLNLFDSDDDDITYYYASRLPGEPESGIDDIHFHPLEPRTARIYFKYQF